MEGMRRKVLIVDDETGIRDSLRLLLQRTFEVSTAENGAEALKRVAADPPDLILLDLIMPELGGIETLKQLREERVQTPVIMLTGTTEVKSAVQAMKLGAIDYVNKPFDVEELTSIIIQSLEQGGSSAQNLGGASEREPIIEADCGPMVGKSPLMRELFTRLGQIAARDTTVLISGESGTGKELVARQIHLQSKRSQGPFVAINCAAIPETLIESELFGHEKGAFTHAIERRIGHCELANGGTLFLDEIGELSPAVQVKLLRFLQEHEFFRIGRAKPIQVDVRIVTATNRNLEQLVESGKFRQDLLYRINVITLPLPALRDRFEDVPALIEHFSKKFAGRYGNRTLQFQPDALDTLRQYEWPGNVRELENVVESLLALSPTDTITDDDLPRKISVRTSSESTKSRVIDGGLKFEDAERLFEREMILKALRKTNNIQTRAAELLGISRRILKYKMDKLGITEELETKAEGPSTPNE
jgi:two-component system response regulator AtoC